MTIINYLIVARIKCDNVWKRSQPQSLHYGWSSVNVGRSDTLIRFHQACESLALSAHLGQRRRLREPRGPDGRSGNAGWTPAGGGHRLVSLGKVPDGSAVCVGTMLSHSLFSGWAGCGAVVLLPLVLSGLCCTNPRGHAAPSLWLQCRAELEVLAPHHRLQGWPLV